MLTRAEAAMLADKRKATLTKLVRYKGNLPDTNDSQEVAAGELLLASEVKRYADTLLKAAQERALQEGVIIDKETSTLEAKDVVTLFDGKYVSVIVTVSQGATQYSGAGVRSALIKHGLNNQQIDKIMTSAATINKNKHAFIASIKTKP